MKFIQLYIENKVNENDIDEYINEWHNSLNQESIYDFLGMTLDEYARWLYNPNILIKIKEERLNENF